VELPALLVELLDKRTFAVVSTVNPDSGPQSSVIWATYEGDRILFSTIKGRRKTRNMERDPRVSLCLYDPDDPYRYVEVRGTVTMTTDGGVELIQRLSQMYDGKPFREGHPDNVRVVCRVTPTRAFVRSG
jgi:PPOX class probable F420-dependent enzyme